jgi:hypothetical protein
VISVAFGEPMEYPLGANIAYRRLQAHLSNGIQNPGLRHPQYNAGSQKRRHGTGGGFLFFITSMLVSIVLYYPLDPPSPVSLIGRRICREALGSTFIRPRETRFFSEKCGLQLTQEENWRIFAKHSACRIYSNFFPPDRSVIVDAWMVKRVVREGCGRALSLCG